MYVVGYHFHTLTSYRLQASQVQMLQKCSALGTLLLSLIAHSPTLNQNGTVAALDLDHNVHTYRVCQNCRIRIHRNDRLVE
jgi:hypothetical protein